MDRQSDTLKTPDLELCIDHCRACHRLCLETADFCLEKGGEYAETDLIRLLHDCAESCHVSANFMRRGSDYYDVIYAAAAEICGRCASACARFGYAEKQLMACAEACLRCANACRDVPSIMLVKLRENPLRRPGRPAAGAVRAGERRSGSALAR